LPASGGREEVSWFIPGKKAESRPPEAPTLFEDEVGLPQPDEDDEAADGTPAKRYVDSKLQTALSSEGLQRRLLALFTEARTLLEEQGSTSCTSRSDNLNGRAR